MRGNMFEVRPTICEGKTRFRPDEMSGVRSLRTWRPGKALRFYGRNITVEEALKLVLENRDFHGTQGGCGVTRSGGEPLVPLNFVASYCSRREGINTAVDTCGGIGCNVFEQVMPETDMYLYDCKHADRIMHRRPTGQGNELIITNRQRLPGRGVPKEIRMPLIPGCHAAEADLRAAVFPEIPE